MMYRLTLLAVMATLGMLAAVAKTAPIQNSSEPSACASSSDPDFQTVQVHIQQTLKQAGMHVPIQCIEPAGFADLYAVKLHNADAPMYVNRTATHILQGEPSINPSPINPIDVPAGAVGMPITTSHRRALLGNMVALDRVTVDTPFYYTGITGLLWGFADGLPFLTTYDGKYLLEAEISTITDGQFAWSDAVFDRTKNQHILSKLDDSEMLTYLAPNQKAVLYVATDIHCPYCRLLHSRMNELNQRGVTVKIIGYPVYDESHAPMQRIWCEGDLAIRKQLFDRAMIGMLPQQDCQTNRLMPNRLLADGLAVDATPALYRADGTLFEGDSRGDALFAFLGL